MRGENQPLKNISSKQLLANIKKLHQQGYRIVQICCTKLEGKFELTYSFDKDYKYASVRITITLENEVPSITGIYRGAFLYENEIRELFGIRFRGINVDYNGHLYKKRMEAPFAVDTNKVDNSCQKG